MAKVAELAQKLDNLKVSVAGVKSGVDELKEQIAVLVEAGANAITEEQLDELDAKVAEVSAALEGVSDSDNVPAAEVPVEEEEVVVEEDEEAPVE